MLLQAWLSQLASGYNAAICMPPCATYQAAALISFFRAVGGKGAVFSSLPAPAYLP